MTDNNNKVHNKKKKTNRTQVKTKLDGIHCQMLSNNAGEILNYLYEKYYEQIIPILMAEDSIIYYDLSIEFPFLGSKFHDQPLEFLQFLKDSLIACQQRILDKDYDKLPLNSSQFLENERYRMKKNLDIKLTMIPPTKEIVTESIRKISSEHINKFLLVFGTVVRTGHVQSRELQKEFECKQCQKKFICESDLTEFNRFQLPIRCDGRVEKKVNPFFNIAKSLMYKGKDPSQNRENQNSQNQFEGNKPKTEFKMSSCKSKAFTPLETNSEFADYQEIKLQELFRTLKPGLIPRSMNIIFENTLVESAKPGDDVMITGILVQRWKNMPPVPGTRPYIELALVANNVEVLNKREFSKSNQISMESISEFKRFWKKNDVITGHNLLVQSVCPTLYSRYEVKLGVLLTLIGGVPQWHEKHNIKIRGQIHLLMVGEPGTGKSQLLQTATQLSQRSVMTTGIGTTSAGLTVSCFKDGGEFILEAGALVLADCGVCCIDEFSLIKSEDRASVHEAMEQQTLSIAKGGMVCKINTRTTILAATNPCRSQKWDPNYDLSTNTGISSSLLSRFDLVFIMLDEHIMEVDLRKASHVLSISCIDSKKDSLQSQLWNTDKLREYINFVQKVFEPYVSEDVELIIKTYYQYLRQNPKVNKDRKTVRMLESLIRMTEAHARLLMKSHATLFDAVTVIVLMEHTLMTELFGDDLPGVMFQSNEEYQYVKNELLYRLGLDPNSFSKENNSDELKRRNCTPSPVRRLEDSMFINNNSCFYNYDLNSTFNDPHSILTSQQDDFLSKNTKGNLTFKNLNKSQTQTQMAQQTQKQSIIEEEDDYDILNDEELIGIMESMSEISLDKNSSLASKQQRSSSSNQQKEYDFILDEDIQTNQKVHFNSYSELEEQKQPHFTVDEREVDKCSQDLMVKFGFSKVNKSQLDVVEESKEDEEESYCIDPSLIE